MRFTVNTREMNEAVSIVTKAMPLHSSLQILEGIYIYASANTVFMKCSDLSLQIETEIHAEVEEDGAVVVPGKLFADLVRRFTGEIITFNCEKRTMKLQSGRVHTSLQIKEADDYPEMTRVKDEFSAQINQSIFKSMIRQTIFSVSVDDTKPILNGICLRFSEDNKLTMVAMDGFRFAMRTEKITGCNGERSVVLPTRAMQEISNILSQDEEPITLVFSSTHIKIDFGYTKIISRLLDGKYINYDNILPTNFATRVLIKKGELQNSVERASLMVREEKTNTIKMAFTSDTLSVTANSEKGNINDEIEIQLIGKELEVAFNAKYIIDITKVLDDEDVYMNMNNAVTPCIIVPTEGEKFYYMILPVRLFKV